MGSIERIRELRAQGLSLKEAKEALLREQGIDPATHLDKLAEELNNMKHIAVSDFVKRQSKDSEYTHFEGTWEELEEMVERAFPNAKPGYRDGVVLVPVNPDRFFTSLVELIDGEILWGEFKARKEGEDPRITQRALRGGRKQPAAKVDVILYRHDVLAEGNENSQDAEWEIISINGYPTEEEAPMEVMTLLHNHFRSSGGTATNMTNDEFVAALEKSFKYWKNKALSKAL